MKKLDCIIYRNPNLIICRIDDSFFAVTNPFINNGTKILNKKQVKILNSFNGVDTIHTIAKKNDCQCKDVIVLADILKEKCFVADDCTFQEPQFSNCPQSLNFWIQTTNDCNLRCSYCYIHTLGKKDYLNEEKIDRFIYKLIETVRFYNFKLVQIRLAGGEPLLKVSIWKKKILKLREMLLDIDCKLNVVFLTNLAILNESTIEFIKKNSIAIAVSLDGIGDYHNRTRHFSNGMGSYDLVNKNIMRLIENGIRPTIMTVVSNNNIDGLEELTKYFIEKNLKHRFSFVSGEELNLYKLAIKMEDCYKLYDNAIEEGYEFSKLHKLCDLKFDKISFQTCSNGFNGGALYTDGGIYFCQRNFGIEEPIGTIFENEDNLMSIIQRKTYYGDVSPDCKLCIYRYFCTSGCPIERSNKKDPHCLVYKKLIPIILKLRGKERLIRIKQMCS